MKFLNILLVILITYLILDLIIHYNNIKYFDSIFPPNILADIYEDIELLEVQESDIIPKVIHRTYKDEEKAKKFDEAKRITLKNNPTLVEKFYSNQDVENYIRNNFSERILKAYLSINPKYGPARADFFRYLVIYLEGGLYFDIKSYATKNLDKYLKIRNKLIISKGRTYSLSPTTFGLFPSLQNTYNWSNYSQTKYGEYNNWHFFSPPGNIILKRTIQQIVSNIEYGLKNKEYYKGGEYSVLVLTGPIMFSRIIKKYNEDNCYIASTSLDDHVSYQIMNHAGKDHYSREKDKSILI